MSKQLRNIALPLLVFFNIYGGFLENNLNISRQIFLIVPIILLVISLITTNKITVNRYAVFIFVFTCLICILQLIFIKNMEIFNVLFYTFIFLLISINYNTEDLWLVSKTIVGISILMIIEAVFYYRMLLSWGWGTYNVRNFTSAPKEDYTIILSVSFMILFVLFLYTQMASWKKVFVILLMILELFTNIVIMQSKTAILLPIISIVVIYTKCSAKTKRTIRRICLLACLAIGIVFIFGQDYIPDFVYVFINRYTGLFENQVSSISDVTRYSGSYDQRGSIYKFCLNLFLNYPILGVGFGKIDEFTSLSSIAYVNELGQAESGIISSFVEGGAFYGILYLFMMLYPIIKGFNTIKRRGSAVDAYLLFLLAITLFFCCLTNDCQSVVFWVMISLLYAHQGKLSVAKAND